jgi:hypothetical protein
VYIVLRDEAQVQIRQQKARALPEHLVLRCMVAVCHGLIHSVDARHGDHTLPAKPNTSQSKPMCAVETAMQADLDEPRFHSFSLEILQTNSHCQLSHESPPECPMTLARPSARQQSGHCNEAAFTKQPSSCNTPDVDPREIRLWTVVLNILLHPRHRAGHVLHLFTSTTGRTSMDCKFVTCSGCRTRDASH